MNNPSVILYPSLHIFLVWHTHITHWQCFARCINIVHTCYYFVLNRSFPQRSPCLVNWPHAHVYSFHANLPQLVFLIPPTGPLPHILVLPSVRLHHADIYFIRCNCIHYRSYSYLCATRLLTVVPQLRTTRNARTRDSSGATRSFKQGIPNPPKATHTYSVIYISLSLFRAIHSLLLSLYFQIDHSRKYI
jgi:hypothetical protein